MKKTLLCILALFMLAVPVAAADGAGWDMSTDGLATQDSSDLTLTGVTTIAGAGIFSSNGAASTPVLHLNGSIYTGGTGTTTLPKLFISNPGASASSTWSTNGTQIGLNVASTFAGRTFDFKIDGLSSYILGRGSVWSKPPSTSVLTGSINPTASTTLTGVGTKFIEELMIGDKITVSAETRTVIAIASDTSLTVDTATTDTADDASVDRYPVGLSITGADTSVGTDIFVNPAVKSSGNLLDLRVANTSVASIAASGAATATRMIVANAGPSTTGSFTSGSALSNVANSVFVYNGKPAIHSAGTDLEGVRIIPDLSNDHTGGNWISYSAPNLASADAQITKYGVKIGTGYEYAFDSPGLVVTGTTMGSANKAICWKADGKTLGYCSVVVDAAGACGTCN